MLDSYTKSQKEAAEHTAELEKQIQTIKEMQNKTTLAYQAAIAKNQASLDRLQAEVDALNKNVPATQPTTAPAPQQQPNPAAMVTPQFLGDIVQVLAGLGLLTTNPAVTPDQTQQLVQQAVGQIQQAMTTTQGAAGGCQQQASAEHITPTINPQSNNPGVEGIIEPAPKKLALEGPKKPNH